MWYEILPSAGIIVIAMTLPHASAYVINKLVIGNMYRRGFKDFPSGASYLRDRRLGNGDPYKVRGLENIPS